MNINRLRKIVSFSRKNRQESKKKIKSFCSYVGIDADCNLLNILQIVRPFFQEKGFHTFEIPFSDDEIGALCYKADGLGYIIVNTSIPRVNVNFALAHEVYHVFFQENKCISKVEFSKDNYFEHEDEYAANLFAATLLMPESDFRKMYLKFNREAHDDEADTLIKLVSYYQVPYMAVLIRSVELELLHGDSMEKLINVNRNYIKQRLSELWLDKDILNPSMKDDFERIKNQVEQKGQEYIQYGYINERTLNKVLQNIQALYQGIRGK